MLILVNQWTGLSFFHSSSTSYTFGITTPLFLINYIYVFKLSSVWLCDSLADITAIDLLTVIPLVQATTVSTLKDWSAQIRFLLLYNLVSFTYNFRAQLLLKISNNLYFTSSFIFRSASWLERELWDLFGLLAGRHRDLRRIITDYGFEGHPLRKDFPLMGFLELFYNEAFKKILYYPVEVVQEFRLFRFKV